MSEPLITKPIFILGAPRSGTSLMRHLLERGDDVWTYGREGTTVWESERPHTLHPRRRHWHSNRLDQSDATPRSPRVFARQWSTRRACRARIGQRPRSWTIWNSFIHKGFRSTTTT